jgi:hypothetical protein
LWSLRLPGLAWGDCRKHQLSSLDEHGWGYTFISALRGFYLAIDTDLLCASICARAVPEDIVLPIERILNHWRRGGDSMVCQSQVRRQGCSATPTPYWSTVS